MTRQAAIETVRLRKVFGQRVALAHLDLRVCAGEIAALLGPNGAGKSTTMKLLATLVDPTSGAARVAGFDVVREPLEVRRRMGYMPDSAALFDALTGMEYLTMVADLKGIDQDAPTRCRIREWADALGVREVLRTRIGEYSKGMRRKILVISALLGSPEVLILDEPFDGLDAVAIAALKRLLEEQARQGKAILLCSHALHIAEALCDSVCILADGALAAAGPTSQVVREAGAAGNLEAALLRLTRTAGAAE